ncbi:MAG: hypothetical protein C0169_03210 [Thermodesulfobacterium geofontis]|uniref:Uncharacterized protein n=1 Tax=Thermodesulfobacterium geofontis TaxID=1295609 RepID=A0A2N7QF65_9BACT|nr:MAG: hypothetical protein C0169_03210 [Thermodesulfobacterium geofontis]HEM56234.1 hypothetical protein [Thermodesulfobium narugense]
METKVFKKLLQERGLKTYTYRKSHNIVYYKKGQMEFPEQTTLYELFFTGKEDDVRYLRTIVEDILRENNIPFCYTNEMKNEIYIGKDKMEEEDPEAILEEFRQIFG